MIISLSYIKEAEDTVNKCTDEIDKKVFHRVKKSDIKISPLNDIAFTRGSMYNGIRYVPDGDRDLSARGRECDRLKWLYDEVLVGILGERNISTALH